MSIKDLVILNAVKDLLFATPHILSIKDLVILNAVKDLLFATPHILSIKDLVILNAVKDLLLSDAKWSKPFSVRENFKLTHYG